MELTQSGAGWGSAGVAPAFADPLVSSQAPYSPRMVYSATRVSRLCEMQWLAVALR